MEKRVIEDYSKFLESYKDYALNVLTPYEMEIKAFFEKWLNSEYWEKYSEPGKAGPSPIQRMRTRIKRPEAVVDKIYRKINSKYNDGFTPRSFKKMHDTVGIRLVVYFLSGLTLVHKEVLENLGLEVCPDDLPIGYISDDDAKQFALNELSTEIKESGYHSVHYVLRLRKSKIPLSKRPYFELQIRTLTQDLWGEVEHYLGYKPNKKTIFSVKQQFRLISDQLRVIDKHFNFINEELEKFQSESDYTDQDIINAENLPKFLKEIGIFCSQKEISGLLKLLFSRGIEIISDLSSVASHQNLELIKNTYRSKIGKAPTYYELVANIANLKGISQENKRQRILDWIEFLDVTKVIRKK